ncbi:MAG: right-handed parallel beta-helix repeat-containing protein, partial [Planctomycetota bacterium]
MKKQMQERPGTWQWVIVSVLILCAHVGMAAQDVSVLLSTAAYSDMIAAVEPDLVLAQLIDPDAALLGVMSTTTVGSQAIGPPPSGAPGRVVNTRDLDHVYPLIQMAIDDANDGDVIILEANPRDNVVYNERIDFKGKAITLRGGDVTNPDDPAVYPKTTFILGTVSEGSVVTFANGEGRDSMLRGLTIGWGTAGYGGGIRIEDASPTITECIITNNQATYYGGGIDCLGGEPEITECVITTNEVTGSAAIGGGINCEDAALKITDCVISNNSSMNVGGGVSCYNASPTLSNCFVTNNTAVNGSGQFDLDDSSPTIINCTIVTDGDEPGSGGIWCSGSSDPTITNCILWNNGDDLYNCYASYSYIEDGDVGEGNISGDPLLIEGPLGLHYLSQLEAGQLLLSPCVDAGDPNTDATLAEHLRTMTTRTDGVADANVVDMGAHYAVTTPEMFPLTVTIMAVDGDGIPIDPNEPVGTVDPNG